MTTAQKRCRKRELATFTEDKGKESSGVSSDILDIISASTAKKPDLYALLKIDKKANDEEIKKAYYKASLKCHPDRCPKDATEDVQAQYKEAFQFLGRIYTILSHPRHRQLYDETGKLPDEEASFMDFAENGQVHWEDYFKSIFEKVSLDVLDRTKAKYIGSEEEKLDLYEYYEEFKGDFGRILEQMFFSEEDGETRYRILLNEGIENGTLKKYKSYNKTVNETEGRMKKAKKEALQAEEHARELGITNTGDLYAMIQQRTSIQARKAAHDSLLDKITSKYIEKEKKSPAKRTKKNQAHDSDILSGKNFDEDPLSDTEFKKLQAKLFKK